ncbi:DUF3015 domain-containing protein [bacterium]|nr:DUF3015 domain-containing protein [bacterium]
MIFGIRPSLTSVLICMSLWPTFALAQSQPNTGGWAVVNAPTLARRYGMAGCGLGSILLPSGPQFLTSFLNGLAWNQVFMISSGTSNCQSENTQAVMLEQEHFIVNNYRDVAREAAQGQGKSLRGLATTLGCTDADFGRFSSFTQNHYQDIFTQPGALAALSKLKSKISADSELGTNCKFAALPTSRGEKM